MAAFLIHYSSLMTCIESICIDSFRFLWLANWMVVIWNESKVIYCIVEWNCLLYRFWHNIFITVNLICLHSVELVDAMRRCFFFIAHTDISMSSWHNRVLWAEKIASSRIQLTLVKSLHIRDWNMNNFVVK